MRWFNVLNIIIKKINLSISLYIIKNTWIQKKKKPIGRYLKNTFLKKKKKESNLEK